MRVRRMLVIGFVWVAAAGIIACSSSSSSSPAGSPEKAAAAPAPSQAAATKTLPHACDILTTADAQLVFGTEGVVERAGDVDCDLKTPKLLGPSITVRIEPLPDTWDGGDMMMQMDKTAQKVPDVGDGGYSHSGGTIVFKKGAFEVSVITSVYKGDKTKYEAAHLIAERIAARL
jgi:hypothetical protein